MSIFLKFSFITMSFTGFLSYENLLPVNIILEFYLIALFFTQLRRLDRNIMGFAIIAIIYLIYTFTVAVLLKENNFFDYLLAFKSFVYVFILSFFYNKKGYSSSFISDILKFLLFAFLLKYFISRVLMGIERPSLFLENNFELLFLILLFNLEYTLNGNKIHLFKTIALIFIFILSGSRSGILILAFFFLINYIEFDRKIIFRILFIFLIFFAVVVIFIARGGSESGYIERIDRFNFLMEFLYNIKDWDLYRYLVGSSAITPLNPISCHNLSYYQKLFSYSGDGSCYSVILHSYILRVVYDHGLIGLSFILLFVYKAMKSYPIKSYLTVMGVILISGLSVSSFNSIFVTFALMFYFGINYNDKINTG